VCFVLPLLLFGILLFLVPFVCFLSSLGDMDRGCNGNDRNSPKVFQLLVHMKYDTMMHAYPMYSLGNNCRLFNGCKVINFDHHLDLTKSN
jgi:hypothetical protein